VPFRGAVSRGPEFQELASTRDGETTRSFGLAESPSEEAFSVILEYRRLFLPGPSRFQSMSCAVVFTVGGCACGKEARRGFTQENRVTLISACVLRREEDLPTGRVKCPSWLSEIRWC
jgi:hypothetical protein